MTEAGRGSPDSQHSVQGPQRRAPSRVMVPEGSMMGTWDPSQSGRATVPPRLPGDTRSDGAHSDRDGVVSAGDEPRYVMPARGHSDTEGAVPARIPSQQSAPRDGGVGGVAVSTPVSRTESRTRSPTVGRSTSQTPGTQFSKVQTLWRKRETSRKRSPGRTASRQASVLQESLGQIETKVAELAKENAEALAGTQDAAARALTAVQSELSQLRSGQHEQAVTVATL